MDAEVVSLFRRKQAVVSLVLPQQANKLLMRIGHGQKGILGVRQLYQLARHGKDKVLLSMEEYRIPQGKPVFSWLTAALLLRKGHGFLGSLGPVYGLRLLILRKLGLFPFRQILPLGDQLPDPLGGLAPGYAQIRIGKGAAAVPADA